VRACVALATAVAVHAVVLIAGATARVDRPTRAREIDVSIVTFDPLPPRAAQLHDAPEVDDGPPSVVHPPVRRVRRSTGPTTGGATIDGPSSIETGVGESGDDGVVEPEVPSIAPAIAPDVDVSIDPSSVARAMVLSEATGPIDVPQTGTRVGPRIRGERATERRFDDDLRRAAMAKAYVTRRGPIRLVPRPDNTFTYDGSGFDATIHPDGRVTFRDRDDATIDPPTLGQTQPLTDVTGAPLDSASLFRDVPIAGLSVGGTFDADSPLSRARGEDPHRFERERFLEETQELRERLEDEARARELARADRRRHARDAGPE
jgi:hypothetical protein